MFDDGFPYDDGFALGLYTLDENGEPQPTSDLIAWSKWMDGNRRVALTEVGGRFSVSTVFLGMDHRFGRHTRSSGKPVLWETMTFDVEPTLKEPIVLPGEEPWMPERVMLGERLVYEDRGDQTRYTSREAALKGHARAVAIAERWCMELDAKAKQSTTPSAQEDER